MWRKWATQAGVRCVVCVCGVSQEMRRNPPTLKDHVLCGPGRRRSRETAFFILLQRHSLLYCCCATRLLLCVPTAVSRHAVRRSCVVYTNGAGELAGVPSTFVVTGTHKQSKAGTAAAAAFCLTSYSSSMRSSSSPGLAAAGTSWTLSRVPRTTYRCTAVD